jgi:hypothetical protein
MSDSRDTTSSSAVGASVVGVFDFAWARLAERLRGLTDEEYFWEPVAGCWTLRQRDDGAWELDGQGGGGPPPDPVPFTTIAWRLGHLAGLCLAGFTAMKFPDFAQEFSYPGSVAGLTDALEVSYGRWRAALLSLDDSAWSQALGPAWGRYENDSTLDLALHVLDEVIHHAGEVGVLRDLYANRESWAGS